MGPRCLCSFSPGGWSELSPAGDLWDREQIQQPRIKGKNQTLHERLFCLLLLERFGNDSLEKSIRHLENLVLSNI